jgi:hypothetical protein
MRTLRWTGFLAACAAAGSCSLALDLDALKAGSETDSGPPPCGSAADCDDAVDCTVDVCEADGSCTHVPDNSTCGYLEVCDAVDGCVPTGDECMVPADCDDGVTCTADDCQNGHCVSDPIPDSCENPNPCIESEECAPGAEGADPVTGCLPGNTMFCEPSGAPCMESACDPTTGTCADFLVATADNDADSYLDAACGGDDCNDTVDTIYPGADEPCDGVDNDCDGLTDVAAIVGPLELDAAAAIGPAGVAAGGGLAAVVWQRGADDAGAVLATVIGADGLPIAAALDFTTSGGADAAVGRAPDVAAGDAGFWIAWVADGPTTSPVATVIDLAADELAGTVTTGTAVALGSGDATEVTAPRVAWDGAGSGWVASFAAAYGDGSRTVELQTEDMHATPAGTAFEVSADTGAVDGLSLAVLGANGYALAYSRADAATDGDPELFATEIELATELWANAAGFPLRISPADGAAADDSFWPAIVATGAGAWAAAFVDTDPLGPTTPSDIALYDGGALSELVEAGSSFYREPALAFDGTGFGFLYLARLGTFESLEFRSLDGAFTAPAAPYDGTTIAATSGDDNSSGGRIAAIGPGRFAIVWIDRTLGVDHLEYLDLQVCTD